MPTIQQQINQLKKDKENLNTMLNNMGVETTGNETFTELTPLVGKIVTDPILQDKTIEITENGTTNIVADEGYNGLNNVEVTTNVTASGGGEMIYSEEETVIGTWIDGKPLYRRIILLTTASEVMHEFSWCNELKEVVRLNGTISWGTPGSSGQGWTAVPYYNSNTDFCALYVGKNFVGLRGSHTGRSVIAFIEYTKTTD